MFIQTTTTSSQGTSVLATAVNTSTSTVTSVTVTTTAVTSSTSQLATTDVSTSSQSSSTTGSTTAEASASTESAPISQSSVITDTQDCQNVIAAWEKLGKTHSLNKTDPYACCSNNPLDTTDRYAVDTFDEVKVRQIGKVVCSGEAVIKM